MIAFLKASAAPMQSRMSTRKTRNTSKTRRETRQLYEKAIAFLPTNHRFYAMLAAEQSTGGDYAQALHSLRLAQENAPHAARAGYELLIGRCLGNIGLLADSVPHLRAYVGLNNDGTVPEQAVFEFDEASTDECPVCFRVMDQPMRLSCGHPFCTACIESHCRECEDRNEGTSSCPMCREAVSATDRRMVAAAARAIEIRKLALHDPEMGHLVGALLELAEHEFTTASDGGPQFDENAYQRGMICFEKATKMHLYLAAREQQQHSMRVMAAQIANVGAEKASQDGPPVQFAVGDVVKVFDKADPRLDGEHGIVDGAYAKDPKKVRVKVGASTIETGRNMLVLVYSKGAAAARTAANIAGATKVRRDGRFFEGDPVVVDGIELLDGKRGMVHRSPSADSARYQVIFEGHGIKAIPPRNLSRYVSPTSDEECPICLESMVNPIALKCSHHFCAECIEEHSIVRGKEGCCPMCRGDVTAADHAKIKEANRASRERRAKLPVTNTAAGEASSSLRGELFDMALRLDPAFDDRTTVESMWSADYNERLKAQLGMDAAEARAAGEVLHDVGGFDMPPIKKACDIAAMLADPYGDGDQTFLEGTMPGSAGADLEQLWAIGGDHNPFERPDDYSSFFAHCAWGNSSEVAAILREFDERQKDPLDQSLRRLLEKRESNLRKSPLHAAIGGSRLEPRTREWPVDEGSRSLHYDPDHREVTRLLLVAGADAGAKDLLGMCCLACSAGSHASAKSLVIAKLLGSGGADPCALNRLGRPIMVSAVNAGRLDSVRVLLNLGADPMHEFSIMHRKVTVRQFASMLGQKAIVRLMDQHSKRGGTPARPTEFVDIHASLRAKQGRCTHCNAGKKKALKACGGCQDAAYCSVACQKANWPAHKAACRRAKAGRKQKKTTGRPKGGSASGPAAPAKATATNSTQGEQKPTTSYLEIPIGAATGVRTGATDQPCSHCGAPDAVSWCTGCHTVVYCSRRCQKVHWTEGGHKQTCLKKAAPARSKEGKTAGGDRADTLTQTTKPAVDAAREQPRPALVRQDKLLAENPSVDYVIVTGAKAANDFGHAFQDPMGAVFFRVLRSKAAQGCTYSACKMFDQLKASLAPKNQKLVRRQIEAEYGVDPLSADARAAPPTGSISMDQVSAAVARM